ncbi:DUF2958 domain-containing protein [Sphingopyxis granuli]|uniref:Single-stranded DNA endonuclease n=1 Tax=Sphingopyxis granuli TaxID=267128 RepID=A0AA86L3A4_9SPHN|nr:DUF2958 domain-containing protein [Sphingopyxis granuli]AMG74904.1 Single-stranded DNA endonuclease [Sphingopyxis granuli]
MILLTPELGAALRANDDARRAATIGGQAEPDPVPLVKFFNPCGAATWLATELQEDDDTLFGLADLGFGTPELGYFSLSEIASVRLPFGLCIERDLHFHTGHRLSTWAAWSRRAGSISAAETLLRQLTRAADGDEIPPPVDDEGSG